MEYMPGIKISHYEALESAGLDRKRLARLGAEAYLRQLLSDGFFHADPHPGNIAVNAADGSLIFYDFGMMGQVQPVTLPADGYVCRDCPARCEPSDVGASCPRRTG